MTATARILVTRLKTTGLNACRNGVRAIAATWLSGPREGEEFSVECRPFEGCEVEPNAEADNPALEDESFALAAFFNWLSPDGPELDPILLAGLNPSSDRAFLRAGHGRAKLRFDFPFRYRILDLHSLAVAYAVGAGSVIPSRGFRNDEIFALLGIPDPRSDASALEGVRAEAAALRMLLGWSGADELRLLGKPVSDPVSA